MCLFKVPVPKARGPRMAVTLQEWAPHRARPLAPFSSGEVGSVRTSLFCTGPTPAAGKGMGPPPHPLCWEHQLILDKREDQKISGWGEMVCADHQLQADRLPAPPPKPPN